MRGLHVLHVTSAYALGRAPGVALFVWRGAITIAVARLAESVVRDISASEPRSPHVLFGLVERGTSPPADEARDALAASLAAGADLFCASAVVHEGQGFFAATVRGVATSLRQIESTPYPHGVFSTVGEGARWLEQKLVATGREPRPSAVELEDSLSALRRAPHA